MSPEQRRKISETLKAKGILPPSRKGCVAWNKGTVGLMPTPWNKGTKGLLKGWNKGIKMSEETKQKLSLANKISAKRGSEHYMWIADRSLLKKQNERNDMAYKEWRQQVKNRDGWQCRISNLDCSGKLVAHHILGWKAHPELRYEVNNGITLCHFHHPRKRNDEMRLSPYFQGLVMARVN